MKTPEIRLQPSAINSNQTTSKNIIAHSWSLERLSAIWLTTLSLLVVSRAANADFISIALTPDSFTHDVIIERSAPPPLVPVTSAGMDTGTNNTGFGWYERGYNLDFIATGLPAAGSIYTSELNWDHSFLFAPSYKSNNAVFIDSMSTSAALVLRNPAPFGRLSFLCAAGDADGTVRFTIRHEDGSTEPGTLLCPDWFHGVLPAVTAWGRVDVNLFVFNSVTYPKPALFSQDIVLTNTSSPVIRIEFQYLGGASHNAIFAVSGALSAEDLIEPIEVTGYNQDLVVEATATRRGPLSGVSTATMEGGSANMGCTFYEQGYYPPASSTGLPPCGSTVTSISAADHRFQMPPSYSLNNAVLLDDTFVTANLVPASPVICSTLSLLCAAGHGPTTNGCVIFHVDGSTETNSFVVADWLTGSSPALVTNGRVDTNNKYVDSLNAGRPCLFTADVVLTNTASAVTNLALTFGPAPAGAHTLVFALSGSSGAPAPQPPVLTITPAVGRSLRISTTVPGELQSTTALSGPSTLWHDDGLIISNVLVAPSSAAPMKYYRVQAQ